MDHETAGGRGRLSTASLIGVGAGILLLATGIVLWFALPMDRHGYLHAVVLGPLAALGIGVVGLSMLLSWERIGWLLRTLGVVLLVLGFAPVVQVVWLLATI